MVKPALTMEEQLKLLASRGLKIPSDTEECLLFLQATNYYRFSGYFRYWQEAPEQGKNDFIPGADFNVIKDLYLAEQKLVAEVLRVLRLLELVLRTQFAYHYAHSVGATGHLTRGIGMSEPPNPAQLPPQEFVLSDLDRSKEVYVARYRDENKKSLEGRYLAEAYDDLPVWVAVEVMSFGTLSRCIEATGQSEVVKEIAEFMRVAAKTFASQVRSFVYLRNRCAHHARVWNHSVLDAPSLNNNIRNRARKAFGKFEARSVFTILVAMDKMLEGSGIEKNWLRRQLWPLLRENELLRRGILDPRKFEDFKP